MVVLLLCLWINSAHAVTLQEIRERGFLRHAGAPHTSFVTTDGDGFAVELMQRFAMYLGVGYSFIPSDWNHLFSDLTGKAFSLSGNHIKPSGKAPIKADIAACGIAMLPWRQKIASFSNPLLATQVWVLTPSHAQITPVVPHETQKDIAAVHKKLKGFTVLGKTNTSLDPALYGIMSKSSPTVYTDTRIPDFLTSSNVALLIDYPNAVEAVLHWTGKIKVIGPISPLQPIAPAVAKESTELLTAFNHFLATIQKDGSLLKLIEKYGLQKSTFALTDNANAIHQSQ